MPKNLFNSFKNLHTNHQALVLNNIWDAASAAIVENEGALALATSSASVAWSNGYADGGQLPVPLLLQSIKKILRVINLPLSVDIEDGYSQSPQKVAQLVADLVELGVVGINIEDGSHSASLLIEKIQAIKQHLGETSVFINARTDVYLQALVHEDLRLNETIKRAKQYLASGADGIFVPGMINTNDISQVAQSIQAPLNIMVSSEQDCFAEFVDAGANRISLGPNTFITAYASLLKINQYDSKAKIETDLTYEALNGLFK